MPNCGLHAVLRYSKAVFESSCWCFWRECLLTQFLIKVKVSKFKVTISTSISNRWFPSAAPASFCAAHLTYQRLWIFHASCVSHAVVGSMSRQKWSIMSLSRRIFLGCWLLMCTNCGLRKAKRHWLRQWIFHWVFRKRVQKFCMCSSFCTTVAGPCVSGKQGNVPVTALALTWPCLDEALNPVPCVNGNNHRHLIQGCHHSETTFPRCNENIVSLPRCSTGRDARSEAN